MEIHLLVTQFCSKHLLLSKHFADTADHGSFNVSHLITTAPMIDTSTNVDTDAQTTNYEAQTDHA